MAEPLTPEQYEIASAHLAQWEAPACPVCRTRGWNIIGVEAAPPFAQGRGLKLIGPGHVMPTLVVACTTCGYVMHFAWNLVRSSRGALNPPPDPT